MQSSDDRLVVESRLLLKDMVRRGAPKFIAALNLPNDIVASQMQSFAQDGETGQFYAVKPVGNTDEDLLVYRLTPSGSYMDYMTLKGGGHGNSIEIERDGGDVWIWLAGWANDTTGGGKLGPVRVRYVGTTSGANVNRNNSNVQDLPDFYNGTRTTFSIDPKNNHVAQWHGDGGTNEYFDLRSLSEFKAGTDSVIHSFTIDAKPDGLAFQGIALVDEEIYAWRGGAYGVGVPTLYRYSWTDAADRDVIPLAHLGREADGEIGSHNEAEGVCMVRDAGGIATLMVGVVTGDAGYRQANIFGFTPILGTPPSDATLRAVGNQIQCGKAIVPGGPAGEVQNFHVTFPRKFRSTPCVVVSARTSAPGTSVQEISTSGASVDGFDVHAMRSNNTAQTAFDWIAVEDLG